MAEKKTNRRLLKLLAAAAVLVLLVGVFAARGVFASLFDTTSVVENQFESPEVSNEIRSTQKQNADGPYTVSNAGNIPVLVRVKVVANWVDEDRNPLLYASDGKYTLKTGSAWTHDEKSNDPTVGYWYFNGILEPGKDTEPLITSVSVEGGEIELVLLSEVIQTTPEQAVVEAWGMRYQDGTWTKAE